MTQNKVNIKTKKIKCKTRQKQTKGKLVVGTKNKTE